MSRKITVELTFARLEAIRWLVNIGLANQDTVSDKTVEAGRAAIEDMVRASGREPYRKNGCVYARSVRP